jgi:TatD DNase family protein
MLIDTHTHLGFDSYDEDRELVIQRAIESGISAIITIGTNLATSEQAVQIAEKYATVFAAVGIHPTDCAQVTEDNFSSIQELAAHEKVIAIGEIGLDYYHMRADKKSQKETFKRQIEIARELHLPLIIHNRDSHEDMLECLAQCGVSEVGGVMHSFSGDAEFLNKILECDLHVSFTGNITYKKNTLDRLIASIPLERLLLETDSPFLTPMPLRGKRNEPAFMVYTAQKIADLKHLSLPDIQTSTSENAIKLFNLTL